MITSPSTCTFKPSERGSTGDGSAGLLLLVLLLVGLGWLATWVVGRF